MKTHDPCAMCARFDQGSYPEQAAHGLGRCTGFDNPGEPEKFVPADATPPCPLFNRAKNVVHRQRFLAGTKQKQTEAA